jgi:hypothetical protein
MVEKHNMSRNFNAVRQKMVLRRELLMRIMSPVC